MRGTTFLIAGVVSAGEGAPETYEVRADPDPAHPGATVTVVDLEARADEHTSVAEVVDEIAGAQVRTQGGLGSWSAVSLRGSSPSQVAVYFDGVPMNRGALGSVDLSHFPAENLERVVVWTGLPPVDRMGAGLGGVIDLCPRRTPGGEVRASGGSFGTRGALARAGDRASRRVFYSATGSYLGAEGDFPYLAHNVRFDPTDDEERTRAHDGFDQAAGTIFASRDGDVAARLLADGFYRAHEIAGTLNAPPAAAAALDTARTLAHLRVGRAGLLEGAGYVAWQRDRWRDPLGEVGLGAQDQAGATWAGGGELRATWVAGPTALVVVPQVHHERYAQRDDLVAGGAGDLEASRLVVGGGASDAIAFLSGHLVVEPSVRVDRYADALAGGDGRTRVLASPRGGARATIVRGLDLRGSVGRYHRAPTFVEMFGDRGFVIGNADLAPETGVAGDVGVTWTRAPRWPRVDVAFHRASTDDLIVFIQTPAYVRAENLGKAHLTGADVSVSAEPQRRLRATASYAYLVPTSVAEEGRDLPGRARHEAYGRAETGPWPAGPARATLFADIEAQGGFFFDTANRLAVPPRAFAGAGVTLGAARAPGFTLTVEAKNLLDHRTETIEEGGRERTAAVQDYLGYPLPGRAVYATARATF